jgi:hypothetical protein
LLPKRDFLRHKNFSFFGGCDSRKLDSRVKDVLVHTLTYLLYYPSSNMLAGLKKGSPQKLKFLG